ncbi:GntR family transcriptional regulator [Roseomonas elaeocarpi]|uniref:GntR family transcriptional regulator n=1 Tax=Roseomonas elaeocarpi TaxID=907779 RepID=A0ABV6JP41_9PROT
MALTAYARLRAMMDEGLLAAGQIVQERRLAEELGLSRTPVRDALGRLEGERLLQRNGRMLVVATITVPEIMDILRIRWLLEGEAAQQAALHMDAGEVASIRAEILGMEKGQLLTDEAHWALDDRLHLGVALASGNAELRRLVTELRQRTRMFGLHRIPARFEQGKQEHLAILDAIAAREPERAAELMRVHLDHARDAIIATLRRTPAP